MKILEVIQPTVAYLLESLRKENDTRYAIEDIECILRDHQSNIWEQAEGADRAFMRSPLYKATYSVLIHPNPALRKKFREFMAVKRHDPYAQFGSSDTSFSSNGIFNTVIPGLRHAHLTRDLSIVYRIDHNQVYLYGFFTHKDLGTGDPRNINRQKNAVAQFTNQTFQ